MADFLWVGMLVGLIISLFHMTYLSRLLASGKESQMSGTGVSVLTFAFWTCGLWILMGAYVLGFWLISIVFYVVSKAFRQ
jgi:hypothetical protein